MKSYLWPKIVFLYPFYFYTFRFLAFKDNIKIPKTRLKDGFYKIEAKALTNSEVKVLNPFYLKGNILHLNIKLPKDSYIKGYIKVKNGIAKTSKDFFLKYQNYITVIWGF